MLIRPGILIILIYLTLSVVLTGCLSHPATTLDTSIDPFAINLDVLLLAQPLPENGKVHIEAQFSYAHSIVHFTQHEQVTCNAVDLVYQEVQSRFETSDVTLLPVGQAYTCMYTTHAHQTSMHFTLLSPHLVLVTAPLPQARLNRSHFTLTYTIAEGTMLDVTVDNGLNSPVVPVYASSLKYPSGSVTYSATRLKPGTGRILVRSLLEDDIPRAGFRLVSVIQQVGALTVPVNWQ